MRRELAQIVASVAALTLASCGGGGSGMSSPSMPMPAAPASAGATGMPSTMPMDTDRTTDSDLEFDDGGPSVLQQLNNQQTVGSTVDPLIGDVNPYGLDIAKSDAGKIHQGDLVVCNFNASSNVQGTGTTIIRLSPQIGSSPERIAQSSASLLGCTEIALAPNDNIWAAVFVSNVNPIVSPMGAILTTLPGGPWNHPFGEAFASTGGIGGSAAFFASNAGNGDIIRINIQPGPKFTFDVIATGFAVNGGAPGSILGPSGLQYDAKHDRLYIVDGTNNTVVAFRHVSTIPAHGIHVESNGSTFSGPFAKRARLIFSGAPLNGPISSALLPGGHLVIGNTLDPNGQNLMVEINPHGRLLFVRNVDNGAAGSIFGMVATSDPGVMDSNVKLYFNDDNANAVEVLSH